MTDRTRTSPVPARLEWPSPLAFIAYALGIAVLVWSLDGTGWSISELATGLPALADFFSRAFPPSLERLPYCLGRQPTVPPDSRDED